MIKGAEFSECGNYRYALSRRWDDSLPLVMCIGLNPSTANGLTDDTTIENLTKLLAGYGYGGFYMMNLFAFISSNPDDLRACPDPVKENDAWLEKIRSEVNDVIFCWGAFPQAEYRARKIINTYPDALCFGKTAKGKPMHPLAATIWQRSKCKLQKFK
jgi:hypothetical protein